MDLFLFALCALCHCFRPRLESTLTAPKGIHPQIEDYVSCIGETKLVLNTPSLSRSFFPRVVLFLLPLFMFLLFALNILRLLSGCLDDYRIEVGPRCRARNVDNVGVSVIFNGGDAVDKIPWKKLVASLSTIHRPSPLGSENISGTGSRRAIRHRKERA